MIEIGFALSSEEHRPAELVRQAVTAEKAGFRFAGISDHFHPWLDAQGQSPFVWPVLGGIASSTESLHLGTMVTCPTVRMHPAIAAQAAATVADMMPGRFFLGLGSGENLNEHVVGAIWPRPRIRIEMLAEAVAIIRRLWTGETASYDGAYYVVDSARIYTLPEELPPIYLAAAGPQAALLAAHVGDGLVSESPDQTLTGLFRSEGNRGPCLGQLAVCLAESSETAITLASRIWPVSTLHGSFKQELPLPAHFEQAALNATPEQVAQEIICSNDPRAHIEAINRYEAAGFSQVYVHQIGPDQQRFIDFYTSEVIPAIGNHAAAAMRSPEENVVPDGAQRKGPRPGGGPGAGAAGTC